MHGTLLMACMVVALALFACAAPDGRGRATSARIDLELTSREAIANAGRGLREQGQGGQAALDAVRVSQTLDAFHAAAAGANFDTYFATMTGDAVFLGTDASERWTREQFMAYTRPHFERGQGWTYLARERFVRVSGDTAWVDEVLENEKYGACRGTALLTRSAGEDGASAWRIARYSLAFLIPNDVAAEATGLGRGKR